MFLFYDDSTFSDPSGEAAANAAPTITGSATVSTPENQLNIAQYTIAERDGQSPTLTGTDAGLMGITNVSGDVYQLAWSSNPDFEVLGAGPHNVIINIDDGTNTAVTQAVAVTYRCKRSPTPKLHFLDC